MTDDGDMTFAGRADLDVMALPGIALNRLSCAGALMQQHLDVVIGAASTEPGMWSGARIEDVVATLDGIAAMAAIEADRLREFEDHRP